MNFFLLKVNETMRFTQSQVLNTLHEKVHYIPTQFQNLEVRGVAKVRHVDIA